ncbi:MAG: tRNA uridine-5-carboxymethylaminomethyl(34) synthesis GTPase MnmE [Pirellulaceae bacterium]
MDFSKTIAAVGSGVAQAPRCILRISGNDTQTILAKVVEGFPRNLSRATAFDAKLSIHFPHRSVPVLMPCRCYVWPDSRSYTGEPSAEIHLLGSLPVVEAALETLVHFGASHAERGEFTLRSFLAGKIDLSQAEAVLGVIEATNDSQLAVALEQLAGNISKPISDLRQQLVAMTAHLEAGLDFVEEDIEFISTGELRTQLRDVQSELQKVRQKLHARGSRERTPAVVLTGLPNAGKSTLFNHLVGSDRAIVSAIAGTTRDTIERRVNLAGTEVTLTDTAGLEELQDASPRALAQNALKQTIERADLLLYCQDQSQAYDPVESANTITELSRHAPTLLVGTKADLGRQAQIEISISANDKTALERLAEKIVAKLSDCRASESTEFMHSTLVRCREGFELAEAAIDRGLELLASQDAEDLLAVELRDAIQALSVVIGDVHNEDILDEIFSRFCIGK